MSRFLFVVPPFAGHVNPTVSVGCALRTRGHAVAWALHPSIVGHLLPRDATLYPVEASIAAEHVAQLRASRLPWAASLRFAAEVMVGLACDMLPAVEAAIDDFEPSALVADQHALAGPLAARRQGVSWATTAPTIDLVDSMLAAVPKVRGWWVETLAELQRDVGLDPVEWPDRSPLLVLLFTTPALAGDVDLPAHYRLVGPAFEHRPDDEPFPWELLRPGPKVLVSLGTMSVYRARRFFGELVEAVRDEALQLVVAAPPELVPVAPNVITRPRVPLLALVREVDAVVCHAGDNIVCETLAHGLPLVVAPIENDQPGVAQQVVTAGAGVRVKFLRVRADELRRAVDAVLHEPSYRLAAQRIRDSFRAAGGSAAAADALEQIARAPAIPAR